MAYTLSFDASVKIKHNQHGAFFKHIGRDVDKDNTRFANPDIIPERTSDNFTCVNWGNGFEACTDADDIERALEHRLQAVKKPLRSDAVVLRPIVLQLDPAWYKDKTRTEDEVYRVFDDMTEWAASTFGEKNLVYSALHMDETNPHLHIGFCPVTDDGRLSQKAWFSDPKSLMRMHTNFREFMRDKGYDIEMHNRKPGKYAKRLKEGEYKDYRELQKMQEEAAHTKSELHTQQEAVMERERQVAAQMRLLSAQNGEIERKRQEVDNKAAEAEKRLNEANTALHRVRQREDALDAREKALYSREQTVNVREQALDDREKKIKAREDAIVRVKPERRVDLPDSLKNYRTIYDDLKFSR